MPTPNEANSSQKSIENQPSATALGTATLRHLASLDERLEIRGRDTLAEIFLPEENKAPLRDPASRQWILKNKTAPGMYEYMLARTAFFDQIVENALRNNLQQVVFLGAGYDSRPYRFKDLVYGKRLFELDAPPTQQRKRDLLRQANIPIPEGLTFVPVNFNEENWIESLLAAGYRRDEKTLFVWEGVTYYLSSAVVDEMLRVVRSNSMPGSSICFDYAALSPQAVSEEGVQKLRTMMKSDSPGEPTRFGIPAGAIEAFLHSRGYTIVDHLTAPQMENRFLTLKDGACAGKVPALFCLVHATNELA